VAYAAVSAVQAYLAATTGAAWAAVLAMLFLAAAIGCGCTAWRSRRDNLRHFVRRSRRTCSIPNARASATEE
jgi:hypothetical protein